MDKCFCGDVLHPLGYILGVELLSHVKLMLAILKMMTICRMG